ncbi:DinB family protein [Fodinisporobacter ferrooxydans]|uniref:DinB family protein n=1 Tax=Fodinisporobacter ferrooxydans TaxID=2901836 RepID=A0ABY4CJP5_9BACL|nr:DinB family protein [Alicyclobacillaceae bacterium MYW30-H2]
MSQTNGLKQLVHARKSLLRMVQSIPEDVIDIQPAGFNNTIRWNVGHILVVAEYYVLGKTGHEAQLPKEYVTFFGNGTKPSDWTGEPPSFATLIQQLEDQLSRIQTALSGRLDEALANPVPLGSTGLQFETYGEVLNLGIYHEGNHTGFINALRRVVSATK